MSETRNASNPDDQQVSSPLNPVQAENGNNVDNEASKICEDEDIECFSDIIGDNGRFQKIILWLYISIYIISPTQNYGITFYSETPDFTYNETCSEYIFDTSFYTSTIVTEFNLVCDDSLYVSYSKSIYQVGYLISSILFGWISDRHGRQLAFRLSIILEILSGLSQALSYNIYHFMISRLFLGIAAFSRFLTGMIIIVEWAGSKNRARIRLMTEIGWSIGYFLLPITFYFVRHFRYMQLIVVIYEILLLYPLLKYVPESPQWLLVQGKMSELKLLLIKAAIINKRGSKEEVLRKLDILYRKYKQDADNNLASKDKDVNILDFWKVPVLLKYAIAQYVIWFSYAFAGYGISYNAGDLGSSLFINFLGFAAIDTINNVLTYFIIDRFKRRTLFFTFMAISAIYSLALVPISFDKSSYIPLRVTLLMIGRYASTGIYHMVYLMSAEIYPTSVRHVGVGSNSVAARLGSTIAPFVKELTEATNLATTFGLFSILYAISGFMGILLPETKDQPIPDTLKQASVKDRRRKSVIMLDKADRRVSIISIE